MLREGSMPDPVGIDCLYVWYKNVLSSMLSNGGKPLPAGMDAMVINPKCKCVQKPVKIQSNNGQS